MAARTTKNAIPVRRFDGGKVLVTDELVRSFCSRVQRAYAKELGKAAAQEFAFHLSDWAIELRDFWSLFSSPEPVRSKKEIDQVLWRVVTHAPHHLNAAAFILTGWPVTDCFDLGAVKGSGKGTRKPGGRYPKAQRRKVGAKKPARKATKK